MRRWLTWRTFAVASAVGALSLFGGVKYSESPRFCNSCHIMEPYYKAWESSKHAHVACVECHYPPGSAKTLAWKKFQALSQVAKYVTRTYSSKPFAEVEDASCLKSGCHSQRLLEGRVINEKGVKFDHRPHLNETRRGRQLKCTSCHSQMVVGKHVEVTYETCYLCHFKGLGEGKELKPLAGCLGCHELPKQDFQVANMTYNHRDFVTKRGIACGDCHLDAVAGKGTATEDRCFTCHNQPEKLARIGDVPFLHENHVTKHNVACFHCHQDIRHGFTEANGRLAKLNEPPSAKTDAHGNGHGNGRAALVFDCSYCHEKKHGGAVQMYTGRAKALGLPEMPSPMFSAQVDCVGCHTESGRGDEFKGKTFHAATTACVKCHGRELQGVWEETKVELAATLARVGAKRAAAKAASAGATADEAIARAERLERFVRDSRGEHNVYLAALALRRADEALSDAMRRSRSEPEDLSALPLLSGSYCATMCHPKAGVKVPAETLLLRSMMLDASFRGKTMPHKTHADTMACTQCHEIGAHKKAPLKKGVRETCIGCHPS